MSDRYKGAILSPTAPTVTPQSAGGIYTSSQQLQYQGQGVWPTAVNYPINNSLRFRSSASAYLNRTPSSAGNRQIWTWSGWVKLGLLSPSSGWNCIFGAYSDDNNRTFFYTNNNSVSNTFYIFDVSGGSTTCNLISTQVLRDVSAWYHLIVSVDTTQATSSNRIKVYLNGSQITAFGTASYPSQNANLMVNNNVVHYIGASRYSGINLFHDGYLAEVNFIDGTALTPSSFGTTDAYGIWQPIPYTGAYGTNGFYLPFTDNSALTTSSNVGLGKDFSGNGNYWVTNNISITAGSTYDSMKDVPTNTNSNTANYCTFNPNIYNAGSVSWSDGNLLVSMTGSADRANMGTMAVQTGKWYWELTITAFHASGDLTIGIAKQTQTSNSFTNSNMVRFNTGNGWYVYGTQISSTATGTWAANDVIGVALDMTGNTISIYQNNTLLTTLSGYIDLTVPHTLMVDPYYTGTSVALNCGQQGFKYTPPTGYVALNTYNLSTPTILAGNQYFDVTVYTGTNANLSIVNSGSMQPDFVWIKNRGPSARAHNLVDSVRGSHQVLFSNDTAAEATSTITTGVLSFASNGFNLGLDTSTAGSTNASGESQVAWQWRASNAAGVSNTQGTITSTVSANTTAGFSIVTYTGTGSAATVGHGLGVTPSMIIVKERSIARDWPVWHTVITGGQALFLNSTLGTQSDTTIWNNTTPTSSVFSVATSTYTNQSTGTYVSYCFAQVAGYSAFGSYTGNGSTDGPFVYLGFRPKYVLIKVTNTTNDWIVWDSARDTYNAAQNFLLPNSSSAESPGIPIDLVSNGIKIRTTNATLNGSGNTYIYMAFAENPFKISRAR